MKRSVDIMSIIGLILAFGLIVFGIVFGKDPETEKYVVTFDTMKNFIDPPSIMIVVGGVLACLMFSFPLSQFTKYLSI
jgi:chemotaxis protein MotA